MPSTARRPLPSGPQMFSAMGLAARARSHHLSVGPAEGSHQAVCSGPWSRLGACSCCQQRLQGSLPPREHRGLCSPLQACVAAGSLPRLAPTAMRAVRSNNFEDNISVPQQITPSPNPTSCPGFRERCPAMRWLWERGRFLWSQAQARNELIAGLSLGIMHVCCCHRTDDGPDLLSQELLGS